MKSRMMRYAALTAAGAAGLMLGGRVQAQGTYQFTSTKPIRGQDGAVIIPPAQTYLALSPELTFFQFKIVKREANGDTHTNTSTYAGTTLLAEKLYFLRPNRNKGQFSSATVGAWYWYHNSKIDRFSLYGKYFFDNRLGLQANVGGDTHLGFFDYYLMAMLNLNNATQKATDKTPVAVQIGIGPYFNRRSGRDDTFSGGDTGFAALIGIGYAPKKSPISYSAELRYINYRAPAQEFGLSTTDSLLRAYVGVNYKL